MRRAQALAVQRDDIRWVPAISNGFTDSRFTRNLGIVTYGFTGSHPSDDPMLSRAHGTGRIGRYCYARQRHTLHARPGLRFVRGGVTGSLPGSPQGLVAEIEAALIATSNPERARNEKRYLKSDLRFIGVAKPLIRRAVRPALRSGAISDRDSLLDFAGECWAAGVHELRVTAITRPTGKI